VKQAKLQGLMAEFGARKK